MNILIRQRENKKWQAIISYKNSKGKWLQKSKGGFNKRKDASLWANEMSFELQKLEKKGILGNDYTLEEVLELYLSRMDKSKQKDTENTQKQYRNSMKLFKDFMNRDVKSIKAIELFDFIEAKRVETGYTFNTNIQTLDMLYKFAIKKIKVCEHNPCELLYLDNSKVDNRIKFITEDFYQEILSKARKTKQKLLIQTLYETGMRIGEALGLCVQNVVDCTIKVSKQYNSTKKELTNVLKSNNSYRTIPISPELFKELKKSDIDMDGRIFYDVSYSWITMFLRQFNTSAHCFRHTRATILVGSGIDLTVVSYVIGDKIQTILDTYVEVDKNNLDKKYQKIRNLI